MSDNYSQLYTVLQQYKASMVQKVDRVSSETGTFKFPDLKAQDFRILCIQMSNVFSNENTVLDLDIDCVIVGDLHGHILDLIRIFQKFGFPPKTKYLFLGDIVDRGEFGVDTLVIIFLMKLFYPDCVYIIRGNHEFEDVCCTGGFFAEIESRYPITDVFDVCLDCFSYMPLAAVIKKKIFCIHGGLGPDINKIDDIRSIKRPVINSYDPIVENAVWSDPRNNITGFTESERGGGKFFGPDVVNKFCSENDIQLIVRGHECIAEGCLYTFDNKIVTVFSASNYCGTVNNHCGVLIVSGDDESFTHSPNIFEPLVYYTKSRLSPELHVIIRKSKSEVGNSPRRNLRFSYGHDSRIAEKNTLLVVKNNSRLVRPLARQRRNSTYIF